MEPESEILKALADDTRLRILNLFLAFKESLCVCEIADALKIQQYNISKHLIVLKHAKIVDVEKEGLWGYYHLKNDIPRNRVLFAFLRNYLSSKVFQNDKKNLELRLLLREEGKCIVGFVPENKLIKMIRNKMERVS